MTHLKEKQSIIIGIIVVCMTVITTACGVQTDTDKKSSATPSSVAASVSPDIEDNREISIKEADYDVNGSTSKKGARLIHVDENYIYFYDSYGLFIYNIEEKKIERSLDLKYIGCDNPDGKEKILFVGSNEGEIIYIFNETAQLSYDLELPYMRLYGGEVYKENSEDRMTEEDLEVALGDGPYGVYSRHRGPI